MADRPPYSQPKRTLLATCAACGLREQLPLVGESEAMSFATVPALCPEDRRLVVVDAMDPEPRRCPRGHGSVTIYGRIVENASIHAPEGVILERHLDPARRTIYELQGGPHVCPSCSEMALFFSEVGLPY